MLGLDPGIVISLDQETKEMVYTLELESLNEDNVTSEMGKALVEDGEFRVKLDDAEYTERKNALKLYAIYQLLLSSVSALFKVQRINKFLQDNEKLLEDKNKYWMIALEMANGKNFYSFAHKDIYSQTMNTINSLLGDSLTVVRDTLLPNDEEEYLLLDDDFKQILEPVIVSSHVVNAFGFGKTPIGVDESDSIQTYGIDGPTQLHLNFFSKTGTKIPFRKIMFEEQDDAFESGCLETYRVIQDTRFDLKQLLKLFSEKEYKSLTAFIGELVNVYKEERQKIIRRNDSNIFGQLYKVFDHLSNLDEVKENESIGQYLSEEKEIIEYTGETIDNYMKMLKKLFNIKQ